MFLLYFLKRCYGTNIFHRTLTTGNFESMAYVLFKFRNKGLQKSVGKNNCLASSICVTYLNNLLDVYP